MKHITVLGGSLGSGGAEHQSVILMNLLIEKGYNVTFISFTDVADHYSLSPEIKRVHIARGKSNWIKLLLLEWYLLRIKTDVLIAYSQRMSVLSLFMMLLRPRIKVISSERNFTIGTPDIYEQLLIKTRIYYRADHIVPNNYSQGKYLLERLPKLKNKIQVITNYTDINKYKTSPVPNNEIVRIGVFCRFEKQKNFHRFLDALSLLNRSNNFKYHVDWYGNYEFHTNEQIEYFNTGLNKIEQYNLSSYITLHKPTQNVAKLIPLFDVMCLPSLHEGFSNSISEYISCGRPVICSNVSDNSIMVHEGENGFLFNPLDVDDIVRAFLNYFKTTYETRIMMGESSYKIATQLFDRNRFVNSYIKLIED